MIAILEQRRSVIAPWSKRAAVFALVLGLVALALHRFGLLETVAFLNVLALVGMLALLALLLAAIAFQSIWYRGDSGGKNIAWGSVVAGVVVLPFLVAGFLALTKPPLTQLTTDLDDPPPMAEIADSRPPEANMLVAPTAAENELQAQHYPEITGRRYAADMDQVADTVEALLVEWGWAADEPPPPRDDSTVEVIIPGQASLPVLALPYDLVVRVTDEGNATYVDMRSSARYGSRDLGMNAWVIDSFLTELDKRVAALAGVAPTDTGD